MVIKIQPLNIYGTFMLDVLVKMINNSVIATIKRKKLK